MGLNETVVITCSASRKSPINAVVTKIESVVIHFSSDWRPSSISTHRAKPASEVANTRDNIPNMSMQTGTPRTSQEQMADSFLIILLCKY